MARGRVRPRGPHADPSGSGSALRLLVTAVRHPRLAGLSLLAVTAFALVGVSRLEFDDDYRSVFRSGSPEFRLLERMTDEFGREENDLFLLVEREDVLSPSALRDIRSLQRAVADLDGIEAAYSVASLPPLAVLMPLGADDEALRAAVEELADNPMLAGRLVSADRRVALVAASLGEGEIPVPRLDSILGEVRTLASARDARIQGIPTVRLEVVRGIQRDQVRFNLVALALAGSIALLLFRRVESVLVVAVGPLLGVAWTLGAMGWAGESIDVLNNVVPQLVLAVGFTDAVHLLYHVRRSRAGGLGGREASIRAVREVGTACALTSLTTAVGFASLALSGVGAVQRFGLACAGGAVLSFLAVTTSVPLLAGTRLGDRLLRPGERGRLARSGGRIEALVAPILARPAPVAAAAVLLVAAGVAASLRLEPRFRYTEHLPRESPAARAVAEREEAFGGSLPVFVRVGWSEGDAAESGRVLAAVAAVEGALASDPLVSSVTSHRHLLAAVPGGAPSALPASLRGRWIAPAGDAALVAGLVPDLGSAELAPRLAALEERLASVASEHPGFSLDLGGLTAVAVAGSRGMIGDLARSLGVASLLIFGVLAVAFGSLRLGLISVVPNVLPLLAVAAFLAASDRGLQYTGVTVLSVGLGLAVDDTIHFLAAYRRHRSGRSASAAVRATLHTVGVPLCTTTALLVAGVAPLLLSDLPTVRLFGGLLAGLLLAALVADLVFLPALLLSRPRTGGELRAVR